MFAKPRIKKSILPPLTKKRKNLSEVEEVTFDKDARQEYLTGFHKRKQQRKKNAQESAAKRARQERLETRKQVRNERRQELEDHIRRVNEMLKASNAAGAEDDLKSDGAGEFEEWDGFTDKSDLDIVDHEEEYIDEDRYTTVTVETVLVSRDGLSKPELPNEDDEPETATEEDGKEDVKKEKPNNRTSKPKKKQFRYESKPERDIENRRQRSRNRMKRKA